MNDKAVGASGEASREMERILYEVKKVVVGQDHFLERVLVAILAQGHLLVEGVPGLAKTLSVKTVAQAITGDFKRIQFTPDLVPADLVGTRIYNQRAGDFQTSLGPVFTNLLLADEINRAPAKVQAALLEAVAAMRLIIQFIGQAVGVMLLRRRWPPERQAWGTGGARRALRKCQCLRIGWIYHHPKGPDHPDFRGASHERISRHCQRRRPDRLRRAGPGRGRRWSRSSRPTRSGG